MLLIISNAHFSGPESIWSNLIQSFSKLLHALCGTSGADAVADDTVALEEEEEDPKELDNVRFSFRIGEEGHPGCVRREVL